MIKTTFIEKVNFRKSWVPGRVSYKTVLKREQENYDKRKR